MSQTYDDILPNPGFTVEPGRTAVVVTDPQRDFLSEEGVVWGVVGASVQENNTVDHLAQLMAAAHGSGIPVFISPHYYYPHDHKWDFGGALEKMMHAVGMFDREGQLTSDGLFQKPAASTPEREAEIEAIRKKYDLPGSGMI